ncbi:MULTISPECIES: SPFH domain-containing protein [unclassified Thioclava]|uniref:SPFH domain-containing protein n=1 Tax=unclassified Thioclava TaxID=2621713 RepID=UPI000996EDCC|nr:MULTISPECIES: SPFH domain-containing protein [unclassified Thioclava]MPQ92399.1 SPFH domain-containing protein [Thioclava sp. JE_KL1]OOY17971.1 antifreeze protein [Thioclava sp. DLFJ4-1]OOY32999.1 antifreeze protein [Thioclava sp. F36-6]
MGILDFLSGEFIDVIGWTDDTRDTMVWRFEREGHAIKYGAKLTVREGQAAVFVHEGQLADIFGPGLYMLETNNLPILTTLQHWDHGFKSPFQSEIYFVNTTRFNDLKWGTKNPVMARDPEFGPVRIRAFGTYSMRVTDPGKFLTEIVGTDGEFTSDEISYQLRNVIVQEFSRAIASSGIPILDMAANTADMGKLITKAIAPTIANYGLELPEFYIENVSLPEAVEAVLDKRTSMGIVGDLNKYMQYNAAEAMGQPGSGASAGMGAAMGAGMGAGMGMAMGQQMGPWGQMGQQPAAAAPPPPPPPPVEKVWHLAVNGQTQGPFGRGHLGRMVSEGSLTRDSLVWTPGQNGWMRAEDVTELAQLFTIAPPPPPPAAPPAS